MAVVGFAGNDSELPMPSLNNALVVLDLEPLSQVSPGSFRVHQ